MLQLKFSDSPASMMVWRVRCTGPEYPSVGSAAPGAGTSGISFNVTTFMTLSPLLPSFRLFHRHEAFHGMGFLDSDIYDNVLYLIQISSCPWQIFRAPHSTFFVDLLEKWQ